MLSRVQTASQRQALWEWPICSVTPGKRFLSRHVLFWPTAKLATGLAPAGAAGHDTGTRTMQSQHDSCSRLSAAPPGRSSVCLAAGEVARTSTSSSASEAKAICQVKRLQTNVPVQVSSHLITLYYHGYGPSLALRTYIHTSTVQAQLERSSEGAFSFGLLPYPSHLLAKQDTLLQWSDLQGWAGLVLDILTLLKTAPRAVGRNGRSYQHEYYC
ncbi:hypothetical protein HDV62DRAFT_199126 [Trichoderma sp. SZMC 28011]